MSTRREVGQELFRAFVIGYKHRPDVPPVHPRSDPCDCVRIACPIDNDREERAICVQRGKRELLGEKDRRYRRGYQCLHNSSSHTSPTLLLNPLSTLLRLSKVAAALFCPECWQWDFGGGSREARRSGPSYASDVVLDCAARSMSESGALADLAPRDGVGDCPLERGVTDLGVGRADEGSLCADPSADDAGSGHVAADLRPWIRRRR